MDQLSNDICDTLFPSEGQGKINISDEMERGHMSFISVTFPHNDNFPLEVLFYWW